MTPFSELLAGMAPAADGFEAFVPDDWRQGRTTYGGLSAALCLEATARGLADLPPLRSAQFAFVGPAAGRLHARPQALRRGKSSVFVGVDLIGDEGVATRALLNYGAARPSAYAFTDLPAPRVPPVEDCQPFFKDGLAPGFAHHFEVRKAGGARIGSGATRPEFLLWMRHRDEAADGSITTLVALADTPPPPACALFTGWSPISTMTWSLDILTDDPDPGPWRLLRSTAQTVADGYSSQDMTLWAADGRPLIAARQTVAIFG